MAGFSGLAAQMNQFSGSSDPAYTDQGRIIGSFDRVLPGSGCGSSPHPSRPAVQNALNRQAFYLTTRSLRLSCAEAPLSRTK